MGAGSGGFCSVRMARFPSALIGWKAELGFSDVLYIDHYIATKAHDEILLPQVLAGSEVSYMDSDSSIDIIVSRFLMSNVVKTRTIGDPSSHYTAVPSSLHTVFLRW